MYIYFWDTCKLVSWVVSDSECYLCYVIKGKLTRRNKIYGANLLVLRKDWNYFCSSKNGVEQESLVVQKIKHINQIIIILEILFRVHQKT